MRIIIALATGLGWLVGFPFRNKRLILIVLALIVGFNFFAAVVGALLIALATVFGLVTFFWIMEKGGTYGVIKGG